MDGVYSHGGQVSANRGEVVNKWYCGQNVL